MNLLMHRLQITAGNFTPEEAKELPLQAKHRGHACEYVRAM